MTTLAGKNLPNEADFDAYRNLPPCFCETRGAQNCPRCRPVPRVSDQNGHNLHPVLCSLCLRSGWAASERVGSICGAQSAVGYPDAVICEGVMLPRTIGTETEHGKTPL